MCDKHSNKKFIFGFIDPVALFVGAILGLLMFLLAGCGRSLIGAQGPIGPKGDPGQSIQGPTGERGSDGKDATPVYAVQLCPNVTPTYPTVFPEYGLCVQGKLYGTYNANTAYQYLAVLPDGAYSSEGQGAPCSFNLVGCEVTQ